MNTLLPMLAGILAVDVKSAVQRTRRNAIIYAIAAVALLTSYGGLIVALGIHAASAFGPESAAWLISALALATAVALIAAVMIMNRIHEYRTSQRLHGRKVLAATALASVPLLRSSRSVPLLIGAALAGFVATKALSSTNSDNGSGD